ncbi:MAG TPA: DNA polymerase III subunit gamma/tau [Planctomycetota bacterium]
MARARDEQPKQARQPDEPYQVVARRFRPQTFDEVVGQDDVLQSLRKALQQKKVPHAFLFSGSRGVGKTTSARILARCLNCAKGPTPEPCGTCELCKSILDGSNPDVVEIDAASNNSVDNVRELREHAGYATMRSRYRVFILDEVHMLSKGAFNALLKTLEEPPPHVVFVLATTELHKVPETIRSRCQVLLFRRVGETDLQKRLRTIAEREGVQMPAEVLAEIAASVRGGVRDAETALERALPLARDLGAKFDLAAWRSLDSRVGLDATVAVVAALLQGDARAGLQFAREQQQQGTDEREALGEIVEVLRWLLLLSVDGPDSGLVPVSGALREKLAAMAASANAHQLDAMISAGLLGRERLRRLEDRGVVFEVALVRMAQAGSLPTLADLLAEVRAGGVAPTAGAATGAPAAAASRPVFGAGAKPPGTAAGAASRAAAPPAAAPPAAPPAGPPVAGGGDLRARVIAMLADKQLLQSTLEQCRLDGPNDKGVVVLTVHSERRMHRDRLASPVIQQEVKKVIQDAAGAPVSVDFRLGDAATPGSSSPPGNAAPAAQAEPGPVTKRVIEKFHGRVVEVNPPDRVPKPAPPAAAPSDSEGAPLDEQPPDMQE